MQKGRPVGRPFLRITSAPADGQSRVFSVAEVDGPWVGVM